MPIEIRELIIKATVSPAGAAGPGNGMEQVGERNNNNVPASEELVNLCVDKILNILKERNER